MKKYTFKPNYATHPGATLEDTLKALNMSQSDLSKRTGLTTKTINEIIMNKNPISNDTAIRLSNVFKTSINFWVNLQRNYEDILNVSKENAQLKSEIVLLKKYPCFGELIEWGYISKIRDEIEKVRALRHFFAVSSLNLLPMSGNIAYRSHKATKINRESLSAWLRCGEIEGNDIHTKDFNKNELKTSINDLRSLTNESANNIQKKVVDICASKGIAVVFIPYFKNTHVCGATRWLNRDKALIQLSLKGRHDDIFWFTFFHELGHIMLHGKKDEFIEYEKKEKVDQKEKEADIFACDALIPRAEYEQFRKTGRYSDKEILHFSKSINISPSIIAGRLSHDYEDWTTWSHLRKCKFTFAKNK